MVLEEIQEQVGRTYHTPITCLKPVVNFANRMTAKKAQTWGPRTISDCQLLFVISGQVEVTLGPETYQMSSGECVFYGSDSPHQIISSAADPVTFSSIHFSWERDSIEPLLPLPEIKACDELELRRSPASYYLQSEEGVRSQVPHHCVLPELEPLFLQIVFEFQSTGFGYEASMRALLARLLVLMVRQHRQARSQASEDHWLKIEPALAAVQTKPDEAWTTEKLAKLCGYHPTYFAALFRELTGEQPKHYIVLERIKRAKQLLMEDRTVEQTAQRLGYASIHYFCRNFKELTGLTPTEFKRQMRIL